MVFNIPIVNKPICTFFSLVTNRTYALRHRSPIAWPSVDWWVLPWSTLGGSWHLQQVPLTGYCFRRSQMFTDILRQKLSDTGPPGLATLSVDWWVPPWSTLGVSGVPDHASPGSHRGIVVIPTISPDEYTDWTTHQYPRPSGSCHCRGPAQDRVAPDTADRARPGELLTVRHTSTLGPLDTAMAEAPWVGRQRSDTAEGAPP